MHRNRNADSKFFRGKMSQSRAVNSCPRELICSALRPGSSFRWPASSTPPAFTDQSKGRLLIRPRQSIFAHHPDVPDSNRLSRSSDCLDDGQFGISEWTVPSIASPSRSVELLSGCRLTGWLCFQNRLSKVSSRFNELRIVQGHQSL